MTYVFLALCLLAFGVAGAVTAWWFTRHEREKPIPTCQGCMGTCQQLAAPDAENVYMGDRYCCNCVNNTEKESSFSLPLHRYYRRLICFDCRNRADAGQ